MCSKYSFYEKILRIGILYRMKLSAIILSWNSQFHIRECLTSLFLSLSNELESFEIFIVDNGSKDQSKEIVGDIVSNHPEIIKPIYLDSNTGTTYSRNLALKQAAGEYILILDSDVVVPQGIFTRLLDILNESPRVGMVVPMLVYRNGNFQKSTDDFPTLFTKLRRYFLLKNIEQNESKGVGSDNQLVDYAISAFWLLKKEVVENVGRLDEGIFYAPEDVDYCLRIWQAGYKIVYVPSIKVMHDAQEISRGFKLNKAFWEHLKGLSYYFVKHRYCFKKPRFL